MGGFPALMINQPESPLKEVGAIEQIRSQQQQQQMGEIQLQNARIAQQENQTIMRLYAENKGNLDQTIADAAASGQVRPGTLVDLRTKSVAAQTQMAMLDEKRLANLKNMHEMAANALEAVKKVPIEQRAGEIRTQLGNLASQGVDISKLVPSIQGLPDYSNDSINRLETGLQGEQWLVGNELKQRELASTPTPEQAQARTAAELSKAQDDSKAAHIALLSMPSPEEARTTRAAALLKTQAETASARAATAKSKAELALMGAKPVFAFDPATNQRVLTSMPQVQAKGFTNPIQVTEADVNKETESVRQFNDAQMNVSRYKVALQNLVATPPSGEHAAIMARILSDQKVYGGTTEHILASVGEGRTNDVITAMRKAQNWNTLTPEEQDAVVGYIRAKSAVPAFQKALTQVGRTSREVMELEMQNIPSPVEGPSAFKKLESFQENIDTASKGLTRVPWLGTPQDVRQTIEGAAANQSAQSAAAAQHFADYRVSQATGTGKYKPGNAGTPKEGSWTTVMVDPHGTIALKKVSKVYANGSFDVEP